MRIHLQTMGLVALLGACSLTARAEDLRDGVPSDVYLATYHLHNPERDYQKAHFDRVWQTIEETQIGERLLTAIESQLEQDDLEDFTQFREKLTEAVAPIPWEALAGCTESVYAQKMAIPATQHLVLLRLPEGAAGGFVKGITNLIALAETESNGEVKLVTESVGGVELNMLQLPPQVPFNLCVGAMDDVFLFSSSRELAQESIELLGNPGAHSKFDDPRLMAALEQLPAFEDGLTFFDGQAMFSQMRGMGDFIRTVSGGNADAERVAALIEEVFDEVSIFDLEVTVEYTEGFQNRSAVYGRVLPGWKDKVVGKMLANQKGFEDWDNWVPANASGYSLTMGANLHPLYAWLMEVIPAHFPEAQAGLDKFAALQDQYDIHLDQDLLQSFTGGSASISLAGDPDTGSTGQSVTFVRCEKPERIKALLHRGIETLQGIPQIQAQNISLEDVEGLDGFEELSAGVFMMAGIRPVIGFQDGWMVLGSHADAVQTVLDMRAGDGDTITSTDSFQQFGLEIEGPVVAISQTDLAAQTRGISGAIQGVGAMLPMIMGMAAQQGADLSGAQEFLALLPDVGRIIGTLDFYESRLAVSQPGPDDLSYTRHVVVLVRPSADASQ